MSKTGTARIHVFLMSAPGLPVAVAGQVVTLKRLSPGNTPAPGTTESDGTCRFPLLEEAEYVAETKFRGQGTTFASDAFFVSDDDTVDAPLVITNTGFGVYVSHDDQVYAEYTDLGLQYRKPTYLGFTWPASWKITMGLAATGAMVKSLPSKVKLDPPLPATKSSALFAITATEEEVKLAPGIALERFNARPSINEGVIFRVPPPDVSVVEGDLSVALKRTATRETSDLALWAVIRRATDALSFDRYADFMNWIFCGEGTKPAAQVDRLAILNTKRFLPFTDTDAYRNVKAATEAFVMANCGIVDKFDQADAAYIADYVSIDVNSLNLSTLLGGLVGRDNVLPYLAVIRAKLADERIKNTDMGFNLATPLASPESCYGILRDRLQAPCLLELIWSYWQEEGMLVQTMNAVTRRFQNMRSPLGNDPLANMEIDPLRSLNNLLWGMIQDEQHRLSVVRRNYEYDHQYGLRLAGKAVDGTRTADSRSKFLEAFHALLSIVGAFYKRDDDTTMVADGFPVLNALKEAHLILSQGAHNQFGDLPSTARIEMMMTQWMLARPEFREFIPTRIMVAYPEPWMDRVDAMKKLQNWTDTSVMHFRNLAIFGEQILLGIRYGNWNAVFESVQAVNWARFWRPQIQGYMHAYRAVTGVDLSVDVTNANIDAMMPSVHLVRRLAAQQRAS